MHTNTQRRHTSGVYSVLIHDHQLLHLQSSTIVAWTLNAAALPNVRRFADDPEAVRKLSHDFAATLESIRKKDEPLPPCWQFEALTETPWKPFVPPHRSPLRLRPSRRKDLTEDGDSGSEDEEDEDGPPFEPPVVEDWWSVMKPMMEQPDTFVGLLQKFDNDSITEVRNQPLHSAQTEGLWVLKAVLLQYLD